MRRHPPNSLRERADAAMEVIEALAVANEKGWPLVVEGPNDEIALRKLGITGEIVRLNLGSSVLGAIEQMVARHRQEQPAPTVADPSPKGSAPMPEPSPTLPATPLPGFILLTDWDRTGGQLARRLREAGKACGLKADSEYRRRLAFFTGSQIRCVEDLPGFLARGLGRDDI